MKLPKFITNNIVLKITSLNAVVISIRLVISFFAQKYISIVFGPSGHVVIGNIRNVLQILTSSSTLGIFNGIVKYVSEYKNNHQKLTQLFSTVTVFFMVGTLASSLVLFFGSEAISNKLFNTSSYSYIVKIIAFIVPAIGLNRLCNAVINGLSDYKSYAKVDLISYILGAILLFTGIYFKNLEFILIAIVVSPIIQLTVLVIVFGKTLKTIVKPKTLGFSFSFKNELLAFTVMSFVTSFLLNYVEIDLRAQLTDDLNTDEAGYWTSVTNISKNYMVFATGLFTLYILPKFATIKTKRLFFKEVLNIYKTILPIFGLGMVLVFLLRNFIIDYMYPGFYAMEPLFKWQLVGDFIRLAAIVLAYQFLAQKQVKSYVLTELLSLVIFYGLSLYFIKIYGTEGIVIAHVIRYIIYFIVVAFILWRYFKHSVSNSETLSN